jgi:ATP-binding cassette, subfamily B, bacterial
MPLFKKNNSTSKQDKPNMFALLKPYSGMIILLIFLALLSNGINLIIPKIISAGIDSYTNGNFVISKIIIEFSLAALFIFIFTYLQSIVQTYASEKVARDLRTELSNKISRQSYTFIEKSNPSKLLTNLTSDTDSVKMFVSQAIVSIASSIFIIAGASILLLTINWKLGLAVLTIIPIIGGTFTYVLRKVRVLFRQTREVIDWLNKVINESILGAALIRVLNSQQMEYEKFLSANSRARDLGLSILHLFAGLIPIITFTANMSMLVVLLLGGHFVITGTMTLGEFAAFNSYIALLIFPIIVIGFMSNVIAQANASYQRVHAVLNASETPETGTLKKVLSGKMELINVTVTYGEKPALKNVTISVDEGSKTAIIGPTAAGKTQTLYLLTGLIKPTSGNVKFDGLDIDTFDKEDFHRQIGFVFEDSIIFNMSIRENIAFNKIVTEENMEKAISTAELKEFIERLPNKLDTVVSERGTVLSGGQKQRIMLARALAIDPKILLLDDFTARVDSTTESKILANVQENYPNITLLSVTQKISSVENYDRIILLMEGEVIAVGTHKELMQVSPEYNQIYNSQRSTSNYELQSK